VRENFRNKTILIVGASSGVGKELALILAAAKAKLCLVARNKAALAAVAEQCQAAGGQASFIPADITQDQQCKMAVEFAVERYGGIDILINCAARHYRQYFDQGFDYADAKTMFDTNFWGSVSCAYHALPYLKKSRGRIVAVCSILGKVVSPGNSIYCGSKFALSAFFESLRLELQKDRVGVTLVYPGYLKERMQGAQEKMSWPKRMISRHFGVTAKKCAERIVKDIRQKSGSDVFPFYAKVVVWLNIFFPGLIGAVVKILNKNGAR
jgi:short-subunit dehydrogenase